MWFDEAFCNQKIGICCDFIDDKIDKIKNAGEFYKLKSKEG